MRANNISSARFAFSFWVALGLLAFIFGDALVSMTASWQQEEYSHGYLIPPLAAILTLNAMKRAYRPARASATGLTIMTGGILLSFAFRFAGVNGVLPQIFLISLWGLFLLFWGRKNIRLLAAPLGILFFCAPLPKFFFYTLSFKMQMASSDLGALLLGWFGVPVFQDGNIIDLGGYKLEVAEACNGIRYLFPLLGVSFLLAYMYKAPAWKRLTVFFSAFPITIFMNGLRIALIGVTVDQWGAAMAEGLLHEMEGWVVFLGCCGLLLVEIALLQKIGKRGEMQYEVLRLPLLRGALPPAKGHKVKTALVILTAAALASVALAHYTHDSITPVPLARPLSAFPMQIGSWSGQPQVMDAHSLDVLGTKDYLIADYSRDNEAPVNLYTLYFPQQDSTSNQAVHSPSVCIPGGGWGIVANTRKTIQPPGMPPLEVNELTIAKGLTRALVYYWFLEDGMQTASPNQSRLYMVRNAVMKGRTNGEMIRVMITMDNKMTLEEGEQRLNGFVGDAIPELMQYLGFSSGRGAF